MKNEPGFWLYYEDSVGRPVNERSNGVEARFYQFGGDMVVLYPLDAPAPLRRMRIRDLARLEVQRSEGNLGFLWGIGYGAGIGALLGYQGREEGDVYWAAMTGWGTAVGGLTGAIAKSDSRGKNALWGFLAGALVSSAPALAIDCASECSLVAAFIGLGAGIGSGIGALVPPRRAVWKHVDLRGVRDP